MKVSASSRTRSGWPYSSSWYQPQAISLAISGHTSVRRSTSPRATSGSTVSGPRKRGSVRAAAAQRVLGLRVVERAARRARRAAPAPVRRARSAAAPSRPGLVAPAPALEQQHDEVDERQPGARARSPARPGRCPTGRCRWSAPGAGSAGPPRRPGRRGRARRRSGWRRGARRRARRRRRAASRRRRGGRAGPSPSSVSPIARHSWTCTRTPAGRPRDDVAQHPAQVGALQPPAGERRGRQRAQLGGELGPEVGDVLAGEAVLAQVLGPVPHRRPGDDRPVAPHRVVGEHRDVRGHRVHGEQRRLVVPPDPAGARRVGVDQVDVQCPDPRQELRHARRDPLEQPRPARPGADDRDRGAVRRHDPPRRLSWGERRAGPDDSG